MLFRNSKIISDYFAFIVGVGELIAKMKQLNFLMFHAVTITTSMT